MNGLNTPERKLHELLKYKIKIQRKEEKILKKRMRLAEDLAKINFPKRTREIYKDTREVKKMSRTLWEMI